MENFPLNLKEQKEFTKEKKKLDREKKKLYREKHRNQQNYINKHYLLLQKKNVNLKINRSNNTTEIKFPINISLENDDKNPTLITNLDFNGISICYSVVRKKQKNEIQINISNDNSAMIYYLNNFNKMTSYFENKFGLSLTSTELKLFDNVPTKEICESMSAYINIKQISSAYKEKNVLCLVVADGTSPKTGVLFALNFKWDTVVVDPIMYEDWTNGFLSDFIPNMACYASKIETMLESINFNNRDAIIVVGVHSHANLNNLWNYISKDYSQVPLALLSIPCCGNIEHYIKSKEPFLDFIDSGIPSVKNRVMLWTQNWDLQ